MKQLFFKYVSRNVASMLGVSIYILADTIFISWASNADGITALNLILPLYGLIYAIGAMIGIGSVINYTIKKSSGTKNIDHYFTQALIWQLIVSLPFILVGIICPYRVLEIMGGDASLVKLGTDYIRIVLIGAPLFMMQFTFTGIVRNDHNPNLAMIASLVGSGFNIVFDYIFMFPMKMGFKGAALATTMAPLVTILICCTHFKSNTCTIKLCFRKLSLNTLKTSSRLGVAAFVGEISSAITTMVLNYILLNMVGNIAVAAYGVVANLSLVAMSMFNGIAGGMQPLLSRSYGQGKEKEVRYILKLGIIMTIILESIMIVSTYIWTDEMIGIFNKEHNAELATYAYPALRLYFLGYICSGINMVIIAYFAATNKALQASVTSILRGVVAIVLCAIIMSAIWGIYGTWLSFIAAEIITLIVAIYYIVTSRKALEHS